MSFITFDLNCEDGHWEIGVLYRRSEGPPPCPDCGKPRKNGWYPQGAKVASTSQMWKPLTHDGITYESREDWNAYKAVVERNTGQKIVEVSNSDRSERADFHKHRAWEARRARGIDSQQWAEVIRERNNGYDPLSGRHFRRQ